MKRLLSGTATLLTLVAAIGCSDPTGGLRNGPDHLTATPSQLFLQAGESKTVLVGGFDEQGNPQTLDYVVTDPGSGITVKRDSTFRPIFVNDSTLQVPATSPTFRFIVTAGAAYGATSFTVSAGGKDVKIPVQVTPVSAIVSTFSPATPGLSDTITLTLASGATFTQTAELKLAGAPDSLNPRIVARDPAGAFVKFVAPPNVNSPVTITEVVSSSAPSLVLSPATSEPLTTPLVDSVDVVFSPATPTLGQTVTTTIQNPLIKFDPVATIAFQTQLTGSAAGPQAITVSADSTTLTFQAPPNATGSGAVSHFDFPGGFVLGLPTRQTLTAQNIGTTLNATFNPASPALLQAVTINAPAGFKFGAIDAVTVTIGGVVAINQSVAADGSSITVLPIPGSNGTATIDGVSPTAAPQFVLTLPTVATLTVPAITPLEGTGDIATAPTLAVPTAGNSTILNDGGDFLGDGTGCCFGGAVRFYKITLGATTTLTGTLDWFQGQDMGLYWVASDGVTAVGNFDGDSQGAGGHPETSTVTLAAGTYFVGAVNFGPGTPSFFKLTLHNP